MVVRGVSSFKKRHALSAFPKMICIYCNTHKIHSFFNAKYCSQGCFESHQYQLQKQGEKRANAEAFIEFMGEDLGDGIIAYNGSEGIWIKDHGNNMIYLDRVALDRLNNLALRSGLVGEIPHPRGDDTGFDL